MHVAGWKAMIATIHIVCSMCEFVRQRTNSFAFLFFSFLLSFIGYTQRKFVFGVRYVYVANLSRKIFSFFFLSYGWAWTYSPNASRFFDKSSFCLCYSLLLGERESDSQREEEKKKADWQMIVILKRRRALMLMLVEVPSCAINHQR